MILILERLNALVVAMAEAGHSANQELFWRELNDLQAEGIVDVHTLEARLSEEVSTPEGRAASACLGPCWELLDMRIRFLVEQTDREPAREREFFQVFDRLLDQAEGTAAPLQQRDQWDRTTGRARYRVHLEVEPSDGRGELQANAAFQLRLTVPEEDCDEWLAVYVLQRGPEGRWTPLFPNR
jgi:hypothetical protein